MSTVPVTRIKSLHPSQGEFIEINSSDFDAAKHEVYITAPPPPPPFIAPPPPAPLDPLAGLKPDWPTDTDIGTLLKLAEVVSGRTPEDRAQAVELINQALTARAAS